jgi:putative peptidoglycan lipid II flippase
MGLVRDLVVARAFGAGRITDAFFVAFRLPNLLRRLVAEGALSSAFIPVFAEHLATRSRAEALGMFRAVAGAMIGLLAVLTAVGVGGASWVVRLMAPGFFADPEVGALTVHLTRVMFPYLFLVGLGALAMGILHAHRHFLVPALAPVAHNVGIITGALLVAPRLPEPVMGLAFGVLLGGAGQFLVQVPVLAARRALVWPTLDLRHPAVRRIAARMAPVAVGQSAQHIATLVNTVIASFLAGGSVSYLYYADRLLEFPLGIFAVAIATAVLPTLSEQAARGDTDALRATLSFAVRLSAFLSLPAAAGLFVLREPLVRVLYQRGQFGPAETASTAAAVGMYALGLAGFACARVLVQAFYALGDTRTPVTVSMATMALNAALALVLTRSLGHAGLALATSTAGTVNAAALASLLRRRLGGGGPAGAARAWRRLGLVSAALAVALHLGVALCPPPEERLGETAWLAVAILAAIAAYLAAHAALGSEEVQALRRLRAGRAATR